MNHVKKPIILWDDHSWSSLKPEKFEKHLHTNLVQIQYMLIPISDVGSAYIVFEPKEYMRNFKKAEISFSCVVTQFSAIDNEFMCKNPEGYMSELSETNMTLNGVAEFLYALHSIHRILYCNKISHANSCETICYEIMDFSCFKMDIELTTGENLTVEMSLKSENGVFGCREILKRIKHVYSPISKGLNIYFSKKGNCWENKARESAEYQMVEMGLSHSILMLDRQDFYRLSTDIYSAYCYNLIFNACDSKDKIEQIQDTLEEKGYLTITDGVRYNALWSHELSSLLEYITYLPFLYTTLMTMADAMSDAASTKLTVKTNVTIATYSKGFIEVDCDPQRPLTVSDVVGFFRNIPT